MEPLVHSHGANGAEILFIAGFGSTEDQIQGAAMIGNAAKALEEMLRPNRLHVKQCYFAVWIKELLSYRGKKQKQLQEKIHAILIDARERIEQNKRLGA